MDFYEEKAEEYVETTKNADMSVEYDHFCNYVETGSRILDIGCGSGRDLKYFIENGFQAEGIESSKALYRILKKDTRLIIHNSTIQEFDPDKKYHAVWACASLLHLRKNELMEFFRNIGEILLPGGVIYVSGKKGIDTGIAPDGRFFLEFTEKLLQDILEVNKDLTIIEKWYSEDAVGREGIQWMNFILKFCKVYN